MKHFRDKTPKRKASNSFLGRLSINTSSEKGVSGLRGQNSPGISNSSRFQKKSPAGSPRLLVSKSITQSRESFGNPAVNIEADTGKIEGFDNTMNLK